MLKSVIAIAKATTAIKTARTERAYGIQGTHKAAQSRFNRARRHNAKAVIEAALEPLEDDLSLTEQLAEANADYEWQEEAYRIEAEAIEQQKQLNAEWRSENPECPCYAFTGFCAEHTAWAEALAKLTEEERELLGLDKRL